jgi:predicted MFS family arabinose efflux permease
VLIGTMLPVTLLLIPAHRPAARSSLVDDMAPRTVPWRTLVDPAFLLMSAASALAAFGMSAVFFHAVPILTKAGFTAKTAGSILGASWLVSGIGSLGLGVVTNRFGVARILEISLLCSAVGTLALLMSGSALLGIVAAAMFVILWGTTANAVNQFLPILIVERFGPVHLGLLVGVQGALMGIVGSFAPIVTGALYDRYSNYAVAIVASVVATFVAVALVMCLRGRRYRQAPAHPEIDRHVR